MQLRAAGAAFNIWAYEYRSLSTGLIRAQTFNLECIFEVSNVYVTKMLLESLHNERQTPEGSSAIFTKKNSVKFYEH